MSRPAPLTQAVLAQVDMEARLTARRGENLLAMIGIPVAVLLFVGTFAVGGVTASVLPGTLAIALVASGLVNLGIATAYERGYSVLKRLGGSPLGRSGLVASKVVVVLAIAVAQVVGLIAVAVVALGWRPGPDASIVAVAVTTILGAATFAGLGLAIAGTLRPEATLVVANVLFLVAIGLGGALVPVAELPDAAAGVVRLLPVGALSEAFGAALGSGGDLAGSLVVLAVWAAIALAVAARTFHWD